MSRVLRYAKRALRQGYPDGLISPRYLLPFQSNLVKLHRRVWWASKHPQMPRPIWLVLQTTFWLKWVLYGFWRTLYYLQRNNANIVREQFGVSKISQIRHCLSAGLGWSIPISEMYTYGIIRNKLNPLGHVYITETTGWHKLQNQCHPNAEEAHHLLGDKRAFSNEMKQNGFPVVSELRTFNNKTPLSQQLKPSDGSVFCKLRRGNQGLNAFQVTSHGANLSGIAHDGTRLNDTTKVEAAWSKLCNTGPAIVQKLLENHSALLKMSKDSPLVTLRVITRAGKIGASNMTVPIEDEDGVKSFWLNVDLSTGRPEFPSEQIYPKNPMYEQAFKLAEDAPDILPFWHDICDHSLRAHADGFDLWAIAWDWAITPDGPILLEGNSGWGLHDWQMQMGSLIK